MKESIRSCRIDKQIKQLLCWQKHEMATILIIPSLIYSAKTLLVPASQMFPRFLFLYHFKSNNWECCHTKVQFWWHLIQTLVNCDVHFSVFSDILWTKRSFVLNSFSSLYLNTTSRRQRHWVIDAAFGPWQSRIKTWIINTVLTHRDQERKSEWWRRWRKGGAGRGATTDSWRKRYLLEKGHWALWQSAPLFCLRVWSNCHVCMIKWTSVYVSAPRTRVIHLR